jgi:hypothetical protein
MLEISQENLEQQIMGLLLEGENPVLGILRQQYAAAKILRRKFSGVGFFLYFDVPENIPLAEPSNFAAGNVSISLENVPNGAGCVLFVKNGKLNMLEGYTFGNSWPERLIVRSLSDVRPAVPEHPDTR